MYFMCKLYILKNDIDVRIYIYIHTHKKDFKDI